MSSLKNLLGNTILRPLKTYKNSKNIFDKVKSYRAYDQSLNKRWKEFPPIMSDDIKVVRDRSELLETLPKNAVAAEVGVFKGQFSRRIMDVSQPKELHLIDPWDLIDNHSKHGKRHHQVVLETMKKEVEAGIVTVHRDFSGNVLPNFPKHHFDWIYVDADHSYESVIEELKICKDLVKPEGHICGHDYTRWAGGGVVRFGVVEAVNEFCNEFGYEIVLLTNEPHRNLSYVLKRKK
ncbi:MAG: class I SAM-dependent methyltransferase [Bacteroidota bacterium]